MRQKRPKQSDSVDFLIAPSEALLLGLCLGEYECYWDPEFHNTPPQKAFIDIIRSRLEPHVPSFRRWSSGPVDTTDVPGDVLWEEHFGLSSVAPDRVFFRTDNGIAFVKYDYSRKSLLDTLLLKLWDHLCLSPYDRWLYCPHEQLVARAMFVAFTSAKEAGTQRLAHDAKDAICDVIVAIVRANECDHVFELGRLFGKLAYAIDEFEEYVWYVDKRRDEYIGGIISDHMESAYSQAEDAAAEEFGQWIADHLEEINRRPHEITDDEWSKQQSEILEARRREIEAPHFERLADEADWEPDNVDFRPVKTAAVAVAISELLKIDLVRQCPHAELLLKDAIQPHKVPVFDLSKEEDPKNVLPSQRGALPQIAHARMALWLAFGEVLGVLRDADMDLRAQDAEAAVSRAFMLYPADSPDAVRQRLLKVESDFNADASAIPEDLVTRLAPTIDALAKRSWPQDFMPPGFRGELAGVFHGRLNSPNELDRRFASIALSLHKAYRNPTQHQMDQFRCSFEEARFFLAGVRTLVDLWKQMQEASRP